MPLVTLPRQIIVDPNGTPRVGALLYVYDAGTTTPRAAYTTAALSVAHPHPIESTSDGFFPAVYVNRDGGDYKLVVKDEDEVTIWTEDNIPAGNVFTSDEVASALDSLQRTNAETDSGVTPTSYAYFPGNIRRYGAVVDGTTDDAAAVRKALDVAARDGTTVTCDPPGTIKVGSTIYLPQRISVEASYGYLMNFYGSTFRGQGKGTGTIFETGTGIASTGGGSNFSETAESAAALHYGTVIAGARFRECQYALRTFNFVKGCALKDLYFEDVDHCLLAERSFYLEVHNCHAQITTITGGHVLFDFTQENNAIVVSGCEAGGGGGNTTGIGFRFSGGSSITFIGNSAEHLDQGLVFNGTIRGFVAEANYFEGITTTAIDGTQTGTKELTIDNCWFLDCAEAADITVWTGGKWGDANHIEGTGGTVRIADSLSQCVVEIPQQNFTEAQAIASAVLIPARYVLGAAVQVRVQRQVYVAATGLNAPLAIDRLDSPTMPAFAFSGGTQQTGAGTVVPFCTQTLNVGSSVIDTPIFWNTYFMHVYFGLYTTINSNDTYFDGIVGWNGTVRPLNSAGFASFTVTASNNGGKLRLTIAGASHATFTASGYQGHVRHL